MVGKSKSKALTVEEESSAELCCHGRSQEKPEAVRRAGRRSARSPGPRRRIVAGETCDISTRSNVSVKAGGATTLIRALTEGLQPIR
jgi:hypothetical protein